MTTTALPPEGISLVGGHDHDAGLKETKTPRQAMQLEMSADMVQELLESQLSGKPLHLVFGRAPVCAQAILSMVALHPLSRRCCCLMGGGVGGRDGIVVGREGATPG